MWVIAAILVNFCRLFWINSLNEKAFMFSSHKKLLQFSAPNQKQNLI